MVASYLVHHSYCATAEAFAKSTDQAVHEELASIKNRQSELWVLICELVTTRSNGQNYECKNSLFLMCCRSLKWPNTRHWHPHFCNAPCSSTCLQKSRSWCCQAEWERPSRRPSSSTPLSWRGTLTSCSC